ncbi:hypothetical protein SAMN05444722_1460 [Rhodovulum sp. ES.010]|uniref:hypothetical protein n=1 Tax=Rhodovulum sp. ES.010 TaxID=1882821 RepID=UPI000928A1B9|nr:hypothetical protein [Rhodovulum sp. ES.010]SIO32777.1 hypothetical protein SAMN05444722_1460 [Rhodovulum sp. ES.010]
MARCITLALATALAGCTQFPELDATGPARGRIAESPRLVPVAPLLSRASETRATEDTTKSLETRAEALRRRAAALRARRF